MPGYQSTMVWTKTDGTAVTATSEGTLLPAGEKLVLPSGYLGPFIGKRFHIVAAGRISNIVTTPGTLTLKVKLGPTANIAVATSSAMQLNAVAKTNVSWYLDLDLVVRATGAATSANIFAMGTWTSESVVGSAVPSAGGSGTHQWQASAPAVGTGFDTSVANQVDLTAQFSLTGNSIQCHMFSLEDRLTVP
jgi:hypothetical protein